MKIKYLLTLITLVILAVFVGLWASSPKTSDVVLAAGPAQPDRQGAWLDSMIFTAQPDPGIGIGQLQADELDLYAYTLADASLFQTVLEDPRLTHTESMGNYNELTFNPSGPTFNDGRLNPFSNAKIREAMNWLIDRNHIAQEIYGGMARPKFVSIQTIGADYARYSSTIEGIEAAYAYNLSQAQTAITTEMEAMGATFEGGTWIYNTQPVTLTFIIRVEDLRLNIGDYVSDQLEGIGFPVDRQYMTREQASPIWNGSDPAEGLWHIYTGGWVDTSISRDDASNFGYFYTPLGAPSPLWQAYQPTAVFMDIASRLFTNNFSTIDERNTLFEQALTLAMNDSGPGSEGAGSLRVWLVNQISFAPRRSGTTVASDRVSGVALADTFPYVARFDGSEGGSLRVERPALLYTPWNPVAGSIEIDDLMPQRTTEDRGLMTDPNTGLVWPLRIESAEVVVKEGLPISKTLDWVTLTTSPTIAVPDDAWVDWDALNQGFITAGERYTETQTANSKVTVYYPADLFSTVTWHDGSPLSMGDIILDMILRFDRAKVDSAIYDESAVPALDAYLSHFKGLKIESTNPLVITTYDDRFLLDAELMVQTWFPAIQNYSIFPAPWHTLTTGIRAEMAGELAFSQDKANLLGIEWTNFIGGGSLGSLEYWMNQSATESYIPYLATMGNYVTQNEADERWTALQTWYTMRHHFWLGTGPFYLEQVSYDPTTITLTHFDAYPDVAGRWDGFAAPAPPSITINYPYGAPGSYFNITGAGFPAGGSAFIVINGNILDSLPVDGSGAIAFTLSTEGADAGFYHVRVSVNPSAGVRFTLTNGLPVRAREGELPVIAVPGGIAVPPYRTMLPMAIGGVP